MKPIIMSSTSVRAILDGNKTQTRRVVKPQPIYNGEYNDQWKWKTGHWCEEREMSGWLYLGAPIKDGDRLWVRETWIQVEAPEGTPIQKAVYRADFRDTGGSYWDSIAEDPKDVTWKSPIFMPKWATRIWLEVTGVRVERVQDLTKQDALAEGMQGCFPRIDFETLWDSLNKKHPWESNPWVLVYEFKRIIMR